MAFSAETTGITVSGRGEVAIAPDIAFVTLGVQSIASTIAIARENAATSGTAVLNVLKMKGIDPADIQTSGFSIQANHDYSKESQPITGYTVTNTVTARVRALATLSDLVDSAIGAGGDAIRLNGIRFGNEDDADARVVARAAAMADAKAKAEQLAYLGGVALGLPLAIDETVPAQQFEGMRMMKAAARDSASTPIETGANIISVEITVRYAIEPPSSAGFED